MRLLREALSSTYKRLQRTGISVSLVDNLPRDAVVARPPKRAVRQLPYSDNMDFKLEWKLSNEPLPDIGFAISNTIIQVVNEQMPDLAEMFPFQRSWELQGHLDEAWMVAVITDAKAFQVPSGQDVLGSRTQAFRPHSA